MSSSGLVLPPDSPMREGNVTGSENAPVPAFASPLPSMTDPCHSTSTCRSIVIGASAVRLKTGHSLMLSLPARHAQLNGGADQSDRYQRHQHPALLGRRRQGIQDPDAARRAHGASARDV